MNVTPMKFNKIEIKLYFKELIHDVTCSSNKFFYYCFHFSFFFLSLKVA